MSVFENEPSQVQASADAWSLRANVAMTNDAQGRGTSKGENGSISATRNNTPQSNSDRETTDRSQMDDSIARCEARRETPCAITHLD